MSKYITEAHPVQKVAGIKVNTDYVQSRNATVKNGREIAYIVMHYTGNKKDKAINNAKYFYNNSVGASAHYFVDDESIYQSVELKNRAWHVGTNGTYYNACRNANSIGIEMCTSGDYNVSEKTIDNAALLCAELCRIVGITAETVDTYVVRHYDVTRKTCPAQWVEGAGFEEFKSKVKELLAVDKFTDIADHCGRAAINEIAEKGIINGRGDGTYAPNEFITRGDLAIVISNVLKHIDNK